MGSVMLRPISCLIIVSGLVVTPISADLALSDIFSLAALRGQVGERQNHGCGPNPLLALVTEMPTWLQHSLSSPGDMMRSIRSDNAALREFLQFKRVLNRFKDCVKTGDGIRAKKSSLGLSREELTRLGGDEMTKFRKGEFANIAGRQIVSPGRMPPTAQKSFQYENLLT